MDNHLQRVKTALNKACSQHGLEVSFRESEFGPPQQDPRSGPCMYSVGFNPQLQPLIFLELGSAAPNCEFEVAETDCYEGYAPLTDDSLCSNPAIKDAAAESRMDKSFSKLQFHRFTIPKPYKMIVIDYETKKFELEANADPRKNLLLFVYFVKHAGIAQRSIFVALNREDPVPHKPLKYHMENAMYCLRGGVKSVKSGFGMIFSLFSSQKSESDESLKQSLAEFGPQFQKEGAEILAQKKKGTSTLEEKEALERRINALVQKMEYAYKNSRPALGQALWPAEEGPRIIQWSAQHYQVQTTQQEGSLVSELFHPLF